MSSIASSWRPTASIANLKIRAEMLAKIRRFFYERHILEVETPLLSQHTVTDKHIDSFQIHYQRNNQQQTYYLQTSPEYAMKRLLAAGAGPIYQISKAFRQGEIGHQHNPEFSLLEWYRPHFDHHQLMDEVDLLLQSVLNCNAAKRTSYQQLFEDHVNIDPLHCDTNDLRVFLTTKNIMSTEAIKNVERDTALQLILSHFIEPYLGLDTPLLVYDFPSSQAALAKIRHDNPPVAERFEAYFQGVEIANGFHELLDANEQEARFKKDQAWRRANNLPTPSLDHRLLAALQYGLTPCAGVAVGIDRLLMLLLKTNQISEVIAFAWDQA